MENSENTVTLTKEEYSELIKAKYAVTLIRQAVEMFKYDSDRVLGVKIILGIKEEDNA